MTTHRFGDKTNRPGPVQLALNNVINCSSGVTYLESSSLNTSNSCWANNNLTTRQYKIKVELDNENPQARSTAKIELTVICYL